MGSEKVMGLLPLFWVRVLWHTAIVVGRSTWHSDMLTRCKEESFCRIYTTLLQQVYNSLLTWGGLHSVWGPPHVRGLLYTCCKSVVFLSFFKKKFNEIQDNPIKPLN